MKPYFETERGTLYQGNALEVLKDMESESIDCVMCSPPYWALRDYGIEPVIWDGEGDCEHDFSLMHRRINDKSGGHGNVNFIGRGTSAAQDGARFGEKTTTCVKCGAWKGSLGLEPTFQLYIQHLIQIFDEIKRVLKKAGTCWMNIGDSYAGAGGMGSDVDNKVTRGMKVIKDYHRQNVVGVQNKSLVGIPERFSIAMTDRGWIKRNTIIWEKPNCMPSSANDRFTVDFEYLFFFVKNQKYYFEQQFDKHTGIAGNRKAFRGYGDYTTQGGNQSYSGKERLENQIKGNDGIPQNRNKRCVWKIPTQSFPEAHFAVYPEQLCVIPIKSGCPEYICKKCGKAREKIFEQGDIIKLRGNSQALQKEGYGKDKTMAGSLQESGWTPGLREKLFKGYTDCGCNAGFEPGVVLDPFAGAGTTLLTAEKLNRKWRGIEISQDYCDIAVERIKQETAQYKMELT